jgi:putative hemolysin
MEELGRCREYTFRNAGQGVGRDVDLTDEDPYYDHLVIWDIDQESILGAYRLGNIQEVIAQRGASALYLDHVFKIDFDFYGRLGSAYELSRSFIMPDYQKDPRGLASLWKGLGLAATRNKVGTFFGSVTISNDHQPASRAILVEYLQRNHADSERMCSLIKARNPFVPKTDYHSLVVDGFDGKPISSLSSKIQEIENGERGIPPLMRYYCSLGAKFLSYHVEESFKDALYCLLRVDLQAMDTRYQKKFLGI